MVPKVKALIWSLPTVENRNPFQIRFQVIILAPNKQIELDEKRCQLRDGTRVSCVEVEVKMNYHGVGVPDSIGEYASTEMEIQNARLINFTSSPLQI